MNLSSLSSTMKEMRHLLLEANTLPHKIKSFRFFSSYPTISSHSSALTPQDQVIHQTPIPQDQVIQILQLLSHNIKSFVSPYSTRSSHSSTPTPQDQVILQSLPHKIKSFFNPYLPKSSHSSTPTPQDQGILQLLPHKI